MAKRVGDLGKPAGKGKKNPSQRILALAAELKSAKEGLRGKLADVVKMLDALVEGDNAIDWAVLGGELFKVCLFFLDQ